MSEQNTQTTAPNTAATVDPGQQQAATTEQSAAAERPSYLPEKFWKDGVANVEAMASSYVELEKKLSASKADIPAAPDAYVLKPESLPDGMTWDDGAAAKFAQVFHANGVPQKAAAEIAGLFVEHEAAQQAAIKAAYDKQLADGFDSLKKEWGPDYHAKLGKVRSVVASTGADLNDPDLFSNAKVVKFLGKVVGMLSEDSVASMRGAVAPGGRFASGSEEANAIMSDPKHPDYHSYHSGDRAIIAKVDRLLGE